MTVPVPPGRDIEAAWWRRPVAPVVLILVGCFGLAVAGCGETHHGRAVREARALLQSDQWSRPPRLSPPTTDGTFRELIHLKVRADSIRPYVLRKLVERYLEQERWKQAYVRINELVDLQPLHPRWHLLRGVILTRWGGVDSKRFRKAETAFSNAIRFSEHPSSLLSLEARYRLGILSAFRLDQPKRGRDLLEGVVQARVTVKTRPVLKKARFGLGKIYFRAERYFDAIKTYKQIATMRSISTSSRVQALSNLRRIYVKLGQENEAERLRGLRDQLDGGTLSPDRMSDLLY